MSSTNDDFKLNPLRMDVTIISDCVERLKEYRKNPNTEDASWQYELMKISNYVREMKRKLGMDVEP